MFKHFEDPKPGYVADWSDLPDWQQETDSDIFEAIEGSQSSQSPSPSLMTSRAIPANSAA